MDHGQAAFHNWIVGGGLGEDGRWAEEVMGVRED
jgi:hypothetical protein